MDIQEKTISAPPLPGVYLMKGPKGEILYIGKALSLKDRVRSYFQKGATLSPRIASMARQVSDLEWIVTGSELEALILENTLVKKHKPRYNVVLRDDKNYPFLRLPIRDPFPRITVVRRIKDDGALYFGPYVPVHAMRETLKTIKRTFPLATCKLDLSKRYDRACVEYEIKRCVAPCIGAVDSEGYGTVVREVRLFLEGKDRELLHTLEERMEAASGGLQFEEAARVRDRIRHIEKMLERQRMVTVEAKDIDVVALAREGEIANLQVLFFRGGMLIGRKDISYERLKETPDEEVYLSFIEQYYSRDVLIPAEVLLPLPVPEQDLLRQWLTEKRGSRVDLTVPLRGKKRDLLKLALENASQSLRGQVGRKTEVTEALRALKELLSLPRIPERIEAFDISNIQGVQAVGSMVVWEGTGMNKEAYRHFRIRTVLGANDFAMMQEVIYRRYGGLKQPEAIPSPGVPIAGRKPNAMGHGESQGGGDTSLPDLIVIDGGRGQLNAALDVLRDLDLKEVQVIGLAKENDRPMASKKMKHVPDRVFFPGSSEPILLEVSSPAARILQRVRDEAHRFAVRYHRKLRGKEAVLSELDGITGIGKVRKLALLRFFGGVDEILKASVEEIQKVPKMTRKAAEEVWTALHVGQAQEEQNVWVGSRPIA